MRRLACLLLFLGGCTDFEPSTLLKGFRVLGVRAEPPEVAPGESTTLEILWHHTDPSVPPPTFDWAFCMKPAVPGAGQAVNGECFEHETAPFLIQLGQGTTKTVTMPQVTLRDLGLPDSTFGFYLPIRIRGVTADKTITTIYRLRLATTATRNGNPSIVTVPPFFDSPVVDWPVTQRVPMSVVVDETRTETYLRLVGDIRDMMFESVEEIPRVNWYASAGELTAGITGVDLPLTELVLNEKYAAQPGQIIDVFAVLHDERGGTDWRHARLRVTP
jgi:hypothetical protein